MRSINYFGTFYLTHCLLDKLVAAAPARIVNTSSNAEHLDTIDWEVSLWLEPCAACKHAMMISAGGAAPRGTSLLDDTARLPAPFPVDQPSFRTCAATGCRTTTTCTPTPAPSAASAFSARSWPSASRAAESMSFRYSPLTTVVVSLQALKGDPAAVCLRLFVNRHTDPSLAALASYARLPWPALLVIRCTPAACPRPCSRRARGACGLPRSTCGCR